VDGLSGLPKAIETIYPQTRVQLCLVHLLRNSLRYVSYKHMKAVATDLKVIYAASTEAEAEFNLELKALEMGYALPEQKPRRGGPDFPRVIPLFAFSKGIRRIIDTTNATRPVNMTLRKVTRNHRMFPSDEACTGYLGHPFYSTQMNREQAVLLWVLPLNMVDKSISPLQTNFGLDLVFERSSEATSSRGEASSECFC
jgi:putative transposase